METDRRDGKVSEGLMRFFDGLDREERDDLLEMLRDPKTFIAEDLDDLLAVLKHLEQMRAMEGEDSLPPISFSRLPREAGGG